MNLRHLGIVYRKELRDLLRDRRTIISMIVAPVIVMPLLTLGMGSIAMQQVRKTMAETSHAMILGGEDSPKTLAGLRALGNFEFLPASPDYRQMISEKKIGAAVEIPPGFETALQNGAPATIQIYDYDGEIKSEAAADGLRGYFQNLRAATVDARLAQHNLPKALIQPFEVETANVAPPEKVSGNLLGAIIPYFVLMTCLGSSFYPAIDLTAGEKERGTMETLLCAPVQRIYLALGKCLVVLTVSLATMILMFISAGISLQTVAAKGGRLARETGLQLTVNPVSLAEVFAVMVPMALFFAAVLVAIGLFARSMKEAQSYVQPLMVLMIMPLMICMLPGFELNAGLALVPVVNVSLLAKEILAGTHHWGYIAEVVGSSCVYAAAALGVAVAMFQRETVIFRV
jgi:sodium transport system permease protein